MVAVLSSSIVLLALPVLASLDKIREENAIAESIKQYNINILYQIMGDCWAGSDPHYNVTMVLLNMLVRM